MAKNCTVIDFTIHKAKYDITLLIKDKKKLNRSKKQPVGFELSSDMCMYYASDNHTVHTCVCIQNTNSYEVLSDSHKNFTFVSHSCYLMFIIT